MESFEADKTEVLASNQRFYRAIERSDFDAMTLVWEQSKRAICVHPGWPIRRGWQAVANSWIEAFASPQRSQLILTNASVTIEGNLAWVVLDEDLVVDGETLTRAATNIFARHGHEWLMVSHHASPVLRDT